MAQPRPVFWSPAAVNDLIRIGRRVAVDSPANADKLLDQIERKASILAVFPEIGHVGRKAGTRELLVHSHYLIIYRVLADGVHLLRVKHSSRKRPA